MPERAPSPMPLAIVAAATCLALVIFTAPLTTLEPMTAGLGLGPALQAWVMSGTPLGSACGLLTAGALGDTLGRRRTFVGGLWLAALSSVLAALSPDGLILVAARILQWLASAGIMACGLGLLGQVYSGPARRRASAIWAAALGGGVAAGPLIASGMLPLAGWQGIHWLLTPVSAALALAATARLPESPRTGQRIDVPGSLLLITGLGCLLSALIEVRVGGPGLVAGLLAAAVLLLAVFLRQEARSPNPILPLDLFRHADFSGATLAAFASGAGVLALMSMVPTVLVRGLGLSPLGAAVILLAWSGLTVLSALGAGRLPDALSSRTRILVSICGCAAGQALMLRADAGAGWAAVLPGLLVAGLSNGVLNAALGHEAVQTVPPERAAMGSAANNTARYTGSALGIALVSVLIARAPGDGFFAGWHQAVVASTALSLLGLAAMLLLSRGSRGHAPTRP
ncbi:MFS transporter [Salipiger mucosus]|uniref:Transmembrane efflux protein n=1 Tax=Salipiger mucosus DSM 16094 TaxID=1123237 RepID=S9Q9N0_9RHOB|nr:MFS transporter [Salipiger mucosus]EPX76687.1 transmembrane efflux protein [Salipiger mucosus DSM 16094]